MTRPAIELWSAGPLGNTLLNRPMARLKPKKTLKLAIIIIHNDSTKCWISLVETQFRVYFIRFVIISYLRSCIVLSVVLRPNPYLFFSHVLLADILFLSAFFLFF